MRPAGRSVLFLFGLMVIAVCLPAQVPTGKIFGTVTDDQGNPLPGAAIEAASPKLVGRVAAVSDENGAYRLLALTPGVYKVTFVLQGFKTLTREELAVEIEQSVKLNVAMPLGALEEQVTVTGQAPLIDVRSTTKGMTMTRQVFEVLPRGRDFDSLVAAVPGVQNEPLLAGISVDGSSGAENMFYVDGTDITDVYLGVRGQGVAFDFVDEVQVKASGYQAEFGGSLGGVVQVITRQGGNAFHGDVTAYYSGSRLTGKERDTLRLRLYDTTVAEYVNYQDLYGEDKVDRFEAGFSLGGFIIKDRFWFYGSLLPVYNLTERHIEFVPSQVQGDYTEGATLWNLQVKLTSQPFKFLRLGASFVNNETRYDGELPPRDGTGDPTAAWADYGYRLPRWAASAYADFTLGKNVLYSLRGGSKYSSWVDRPDPRDGPRHVHLGTGAAAFPDIPAEYIKPVGWANYPLSAAWVTQRSVAQKTFVGNDLAFYFNFAGEHAWKAGAQWSRTSEDSRDGYGYDYAPHPNVNFYWGRSVIHWGHDYGRGTYGYYAASGMPASGPRGYFYKIHNDRWSLFLQDSWTIKDRLTLNLGVRAESEYLPSYSDEPAYKGLKPIEFDFGDKLAPRLGLVYDVLGDSSLKIFGSYGLYYDVMKLYQARIAFGGNKYKVAYYALDTYEWDKIGKDGYYPGALLGVLDFKPASFDRIDPGLKPMGQREISFGVEKKLGENSSATLRLVQKRIRYAVEDAGTGTGNDYVLYTTNPGYGYSLTTADGGKLDEKYLDTPPAKREYWGLNLSLDKRFAGRWLAGFSYTWSRLTGNYSGLANSDGYTYSIPGQGTNQPNAEPNFNAWYQGYDKNLDPLDGPLGTDRPHVFKLYGAYTFPFRLTIGGLLNAMSGTPVTEIWRVSMNYLPGNRGNLGRTPFFWFANLYAEYGVRLGGNTLHFNVNVDNFFNVSTATTYWPVRTLTNLTVTEDQIMSKDWELETSGYVPDARFRMEYSFYPPITARLGVRYSF